METTYEVTGSNIFNAWFSKDLFFTKFEPVNINGTKLPKIVKLLKVGWAYNIYQNEESFFISGTWQDKEDHLVEVKLPSECKDSSDGTSQFLMSGNDYNLILINKITKTLWWMNIEYESIVKKISFAIETPIPTFIEVTNPHENNTIIKLETTNHSCIYLTSTGEVYTGFLPSHITTAHCLGKVCDIQCGYEHFVLVTDSGAVYTWGNGRRLQLGHGDLNDLEIPKIIDALAGVKIIKIAAGGWHSLALSEFGDLYAWGWNDTGQLGTKSKIDSAPGLPVLVNLYNINGTEVSLNVRDIACGSRHSAIILEDNSVWTTGCNKYGQLGFSPDIFPSGQTFRKTTSCKDSSTLICGPWTTVIETDLQI